MALRVLSAAAAAYQQHDSNIDFGDGGVAFFASPQIPPRNINWAASGKWVHLAKVGFEKYFISKIKRGESVPFYERMALDLIGAHKLKSPSKNP